MAREPKLLFDYFAELSQIPRGSGNEAGVLDWVRRFAEKNGFGFQTDGVGNGLVSVPARGRGHASKPVTIQAHMDMVCVKDEGIAHDFTKDPILLRETEWSEKGNTRTVLMGTQTTLGADNGIGLVAGMAIATDSDVSDCPPLELLCTVDEERGLTGAMHVDPALLCTDLLINLDTEEMGEICISCAGGRDLLVEWALERGDVPTGFTPVKIGLSGLPGGHSGVQIHERRGNAILMLLSELEAVPGLVHEALLADFVAGSARNVIPSGAEVLLYIPVPLVEPTLAHFRDEAIRAKIEAQIIADEDQKVAFAVEVLESTSHLPISAEATSTILRAISGIPNGVQKMSEIVDGLVETSNNVAVIRTNETALKLQCSTRSSKPGAIEEFQEVASGRLAAFGAKVSHSDGYPGWPAEAHNPLLIQAEKTFERVLGHPPKVTAVHAGLECGVLKGKRPSLQMISFGPDIFGAHTVNERIALDSVPPFYECLKELLVDLAVGGEREE